MIRKGNYDDAAEMARIFNHYVRTSTAIFSNRELTAEEMRRKLESLGVGTVFPFLVSEAPDGTLTGYCYAHRWMPDPVYDRSWELTMYLSKDHLGQGIGSRMFRQLINDCRQRKAHVLVANVTEGNAPSEKMCMAEGFREVGRMPEIGFKFGAYHTDVIYQMIL